MKYDRKLILEDGTIYRGTGFGGSGQRVCEIVFNTSMAGYQEIVSDPSYTDQAVVMSYPLMGNYGITDEDYESKIISPSAMIVRDINNNPSNFRWAKTLAELLEENGIPGISGIDQKTGPEHPGPGIQEMPDHRQRFVPGGGGGGNQEYPGAP